MFWALQAWSECRRAGESRLKRGGDHRLNHGERLLLNGGRLPRRLVACALARALSRGEEEGGRKGGNICRRPTLFVTFSQPVLQTRPVNHVTFLTEQLETSCNISKMGLRVCVLQN